MQKYMTDITAAIVCSDSHYLVKEAVESFRFWHPEMKLIIIDGSSKDDPCYNYVRSLVSPVTDVRLCNYNIGHGRGMNLALSIVKTKYALIFDSDIVMDISPVGRMLSMFEDDTYGVGYLEKTGFDGFEYGSHTHHKSEGFMKMLHPYFMLLQVSEYFKFAPFVHHGAPCYKAALDIHRRGLTSKIIKEFPGLGHSSGKGWNWKGEPREFIQHHTAGTRKLRRGKGLQEIEQGWER